ncbi:hypothetical protein QQS21_002484 [Conoideocrella luteorostrata]|uniref:Heterokaryon incompatibility domain-containing protein n=1 Tax=Conoideocrella luteorostrata TaxID=1105319 RepID=A0AAJ0G1B5_9HYPO|nr:hypothetical protein QQS21_002484 [Conoideocrella luteorostrata]
MGNIYKAASQVLVWLENDFAATKTIELPSRELRNRNLDWLRRLAEATGQRHCHEREDQLSRVAGELNSEMGNNVTVASLKETLTCLPWFKRLWVIQEVVLSKRAILVCNEFEIPLDAIIKAKDILTSLKYQGKHGVGAAMSVLWEFMGVHQFGMSLLQQSLAQGKVPGDALQLFIWEVRFSKATDPKDKMFGLYGLFRECGINLPKPNYAKSVSTVYRETLVALMEATGTLALIPQIDGLGALQLTE